MSQTQSAERDWSSLPTELITIIHHNLNSTITDRRRLRSVCTAWRASLTLSKPLLHFPLEIPLLPKPIRGFGGWVLDSDSGSGSEPPVFETGFLIQSAFYLISGPNQTAWLTRVEESPGGPPNYWSILNPFSYDRLFQPLPEIKVNISFLDRNIHEIARSYSLFTGYLYDEKVIKVVKLVVFPKNGEIVEDGVFSVSILFGFGDLGLWKFGEKEWKIVPNNGCSFADVIVFEDKFYMTDLKGKVKVIDPVTFEARDVITSNVEFCDGMFTYLVESKGKLYLVNKKVNTRAGFKEAIYPDPKMKKMVRTNVYCEPLQPMGFGVWVLKRGDRPFWDPTWSLDDQVFFVSEYVTFSMSAKEVGWKRGDCIFFNQEGFRGHVCYGGYGSDNKCDRSNHTYKSELQLFTKKCGIFVLPQGSITTTSDERLPRPFKIFWPVPK
ncbi:F-box protein SKIP23-like [Silene latifolia]|uniref:F-box protein SKIP23-like n=1 Tax=Silene latifolia TaxID=37657 RepID=UPI003D76F7F8